VTTASSAGKQSMVKDAAQTTTGQPSQQKKAQANQLAANPALQSATQAATAAVAAAMAKLPMAAGQKPQSQPPNRNGVDDLTRQVQELKTNDAPRPPRHTSGAASGPAAHHRGGRSRGGSHGTATRKIEVPETDYDFETANAMFNKKDLVKEVIATGSTASMIGDKASTAAGASNGVADGAVAAADGSNGSNNGAGSQRDGAPEFPASGPSYNRAASFFDNISSEAKDREGGNTTRPGGRQWRGEEQKKNLETFGQGSVDTGYRTNYRGRGGRGRGHGGARGRTGYGGHGGRGGGQHHHNHHHHSHQLGGNSSSGGGGSGGGGSGTGGRSGGGGRGRYRGDHTGGQTVRGAATAVVAST
jgi:protein LSM14